MLIYKYYNIEKGLEFLEKRRLYFTPPQFFNDIHEFSPKPFNEISIEEYGNYIKCNPDIIKKMYDDSRDIFQEDFGVFLDKLLNNKKYNKLLKERIYDATRDLYTNLKKIVSDYIGVCCFTKRWNSNLMWGHYAASHQGICIGFQMEKSELKFACRDFVNYEQDKYLLPLKFQSSNHEEKVRYFKEIAFRKEEDWGYEKEYRYMVFLEHCKNETRKDGNYYYQDINRSDIKEIILGINCNKYDDIYNLHLNSDIYSTFCNQDNYLIERKKN